VDCVADEEPLIALLDHPVAKSIPMLLITNNEEIADRYSGKVAGRIRSDFRKSTLLSAIHNALARGVARFEPIGDKVLCVDDDPEILSFMQRCLEAEGYEVELCQSGDEAMKRVQSRDFGLVLLDVSMPGMDGWETCRRMKASPGIDGIKVYMVTAKPVDRDPAMLSESGADGFLLKPFRPEDLVQLVRGLEIRTTAK
jgi:CheY-like chemotaxis protein